MRENSWLRDYALFLAALSATKQIQQSQGDFRIAVPIICLLYTSLLEIVNERCDLELEIPEQLKLFQLSEEHRRLVVIEVIDEPYLLRFQVLFLPHRPELHHEKQR